MTDSTRHRGPHPEDVVLFNEPGLLKLRDAAIDLAWLLTRGYGRESAIRIVGDHHQLRQRQRTAIGRVVCSDQEKREREAKKVDALTDKSLFVDGYNVLTTVESALGGGVVLSCRDSTYRDLAGLGGTYRKAIETPKALSIITNGMRGLNVKEVLFYLDQPVSNSAKLRLDILEAARESSLPCQVELRSDVDRTLKNTDGIVASSDSAILDRCKLWFNLARFLVDSYCRRTWLVSVA